MLKRLYSVLSTNRSFEAMLLSGNALFAIGTWVGLVPLQVYVTVAAWNP